VKALLFDFDGLILDTETPEFEAWSALYQQHGQELSPELWGQFVGGDGASNFDPAVYLQTLAGTSLSPEDLRQQARRLAGAQILLQRPRPQMGETLAAAQALGFRLAVVSSSPRAWVEGHLQRLQLLSAFERLICREDVAPGRAKPHPDLYQKALKEMNLDPSQALVFEDSPNGALAGLRAGLPVAFVPNPLTARLAAPQGVRQLPTLPGAALADLWEACKADFESGF